jgi:hypothetical protein
MSAGTAVDEDAPAVNSHLGPPSDDDMRVFVGPNWIAYRELWARMEGAPGLRFRRSLSASVFSSLWLLYRKQYVLGVAILAAQVAITETAAAWSSLFDVLVAAVCGQFGMSLVLLRGVRVIARLHASPAAPEIMAIRIQAAGGVNWVAAFSAAALLTGVALAGFTGGLTNIASYSDTVRAALGAP